MSNTTMNIFWFRRDLRLLDNTALFHALQEKTPVQPIFIFDTNILDKLEDRDDARVTFIYDQVMKIKQTLNESGKDLWVFHGTPEDVFRKIFKENEVRKVFLNTDYEPYARKRDQKIQELCVSKNIHFSNYKDHVVFEKSEVVKDDGKPYTIFTPYKRKWLAKFHENPPLVYTYSLQEVLAAMHQTADILPMIEWEDIGFQRSQRPIPSIEVSRKIIMNYDKNRDFPAMDATSKLGIHFRFGTISIREKALTASNLNQTYLNELIWRDFYAMILWFFPEVVHAAFRPEYDGIEWSHDMTHFEAWCEGRTGYPLVDAGMRQLLQTGYMHNRVRMITASFLTKHLLINWRLGEAWFARHLLDFDLASNNGGWQWAAGCGTDAAPYFRIFNPSAQADKFDKHFEYVKKWVPEFGTSRYPKPIVDHATARKTCLEVYAKALKR